MDEREQRLLAAARQVDAVAGAQGEVARLAEALVREPGREATQALLRHLSGLDRNRQDGWVAAASKALTDRLIEYLGALRVRELCGAEERAEEEDPRSLGELLAELDGLVGLAEVKRKVGDLIAYQRVQALRKEAGLKCNKGTLHLAFTGNPGTGKTTVARIVGRIYRRLGLLSRGHFIEASRTDLIAGYQGQTALKVKRVVERAKGGVLFIDEAYSITENDHSDSYGRECLTELTKALEDYRDDLVVIVAGYTEPMNHFFESNPGLRSRFNTFIEFPDYSAAELEAILLAMCAADQYLLAPEALTLLRPALRQAVREKDGATFANGRLARNLYERLVMNLARRVAKAPYPTRDDLQTITAADCREALPLAPRRASTPRHLVRERLRRRPRR